MNTVTRNSRLLVKLSGSPARASIAFQTKSLSFDFEPLFSSIRSGGEGIATAKQPQWHIMSSRESQPETNSWDLCHHLVVQGHGLAGLPKPEFAEPDFEQQWTTGSAVQHALAAVRPCDAPS